MKCSFLLDQATEESAHETPQVSGLAARIAAFRASFADPVTVANHAVELEAAKAGNSRLSDENATLKAENEKLKAELVAASAELDGIQHALSIKGDVSPVTALEQKISARVADTVASLGVDPAALPQATKKDTTETADDLRAQLNAEQDPVKRGQIASKLRAIRNQSN